MKEEGRRKKEEGRRILSRGFKVMKEEGRRILSRGFKPMKSDVKSQNSEERRIITRELISVWSARLKTSSFFLLSSSFFLIPCQIDAANALTLMGLTFSFISTVFAIQGQFYAAIICMIFAGIIDLFDGFVARRIQRKELQAQVGKQLDSLVDVCSFGFAPAIFAYCFGLRDAISIAVLVIYVSMNALRLAYFNSTGLAVSGGEEYFTGLPVTYAALFIPLTFTASFFLPNSTMNLVLDGLYLLLAIAMVSGFKMLKLRGVWYALFSLGAIALTGIYSWAIVVDR